MPEFHRDDVVVLVRGCKGLVAGSRGTVLRNDIRGTEAPSVVVRWVAPSEGGSVRGHRESSLEKYADYEAKKKAEALQPSSNGYDRKLALLGVDLEAPVGLGAAVALSHNLRELSATVDRLKALNKAVKNVVLYKGAGLVLYLVIQGKNIQLVKEVEGEEAEFLSVPLSVYLDLVGTYKAGR